MRNAINNDLRITLVRRTLSYVSRTKKKVVLLYIYIYIFIIIVVGYSIHIFIGLIREQRAVAKRHEPTMP